MILIDVNALKEWVENWFAKNRFYHPYAKNNNIPITELYDILEQMPTIEPKQRWIPCSERLPKPYQYCLWTTTDGRVVYHHCDGLFSNYTAWMPLPEPWKGEEHEAD